MKYEERTPRSKELFEEARKVLPGGVTYSLRYFEPYPFYVKRAEGCKLWDVDGNEYTDYWLAHGAVVVGHGYKPVIDAVREQLEYGTHFGWCNEWEIKWAEAVCRWFPSAEMVRPTNSGTEANMYAIRVARAYTGRKKVGKFKGHWHGGYDGLHKGVSYPYDKPASLGLTDSVMNDIVLLSLDLDEVRRKASEEELACIIIEPIMGIGGFIPIGRDFLEGLRELCDEKGIVLIFDEVITGFRFPGGAQSLYGVTPDMTTLGKTVGGQYFPGAGAFCGKAEIMEKIDQIKYPNFWERAFHGGTYTGNPLTMRAGYVLISELERRKDEIYPYLDRLGEKIRRGLEDIFDRMNFRAFVTGIGSLFGVHFTKEKPVDGETAERTKDKEMNKRFFRFMIDHGIAYLSPQKAHFFLSAAHTENEIKYFLSVVEEFVRVNKRG